MGNKEEGKSSKTDKLSSPTLPDQTNIHMYPDWAAMQAYYSPTVPLPPYYFSAMPSGHPPHPYMWGPRPMMPPYGSPYAALRNTHEGVYARPAASLNAVPLRIETPTKSSGIMDCSLMKKLKGFDGLAMSIGNGNANGPEGACEHGLSKSVDTEGFSDGIDGSTLGVDQTKRKRSQEETPTAEGENQAQTGSITAGETTSASNKVLGTAGGPANIIGNAAGTVLSPGMSTVLTLRNSSTWLRKQAETEELAHRVECLTAENVGLKSKIGQLTDKSDKLRRENAALMEKLKIAQLVRTVEMGLNNMDDKRAPPVSTEQESEVYEKKSNSGAKLHQLLSDIPRADAVSAG
ncbi:common plant regulatory factor 1-like [Carica papaya]|uniref:common plant regulatory factor 1-like n=1 Tax=Carica papaya TaxID=3649 RepID=UPI000B8CC68D|nr:common plant regulatory factor 1-like [Carica papaya]